jgi:hypothetical protein
MRFELRLLAAGILIVLVIAAAFHQQAVAGPCAPPASTMRQ